MIDLHIHSICSDGSDNICDLLNNLKENNITRFALTDHDTAEGCRQIIDSGQNMKFLKDNNIEFVVGAEWTALYENQKMHILAYDFNPFDEKVLKLEKEMHDMLIEKDKFRIAELKNKGYSLSNHSMKYLTTKENVRTLDFAKCLVDDGYFDDIQVAAGFLTKEIKYNKECRFGAVYLLNELSKIGAKIVWAHSIYDIKRKVISFERVEEIIKELKPYGLAGLECCYSLYNKEEIDKLIAIAKRNDLFVTQGSDYHGQNKSVRLGTFSSDGSFVDESIIYDKFNGLKKVER
jgi:predicted metal-dependent phosphoesterase TrpH